MCSNWLLCLTSTASCKWVFYSKKKIIIIIWMVKFEVNIEVENREFEKQISSSILKNRIQSKKYNWNWITTGWTLKVAYLDNEINDFL